MFDLLPPELVLSILSYLPIRQLQRLCQVSRYWNLFMATNEEKIFHAAAILHGFVPAQTKSLQSVPIPKWLEDDHSWKGFCYKSYKTDLRWEGQEPAHSSHVGAAGKAVWRFKIDEEQQTVIQSHFDGGLRVSPIESCGSDILWLLPHSEVHGYAHVEFTNGFMVFTRRGDAIDVWRRKSDARTAFRPSTLYNDSLQLRAQNIAWQSELSSSQDDRGAFVPWTTILPAHPIHALRATNSKLLLASQRAGEAYLYDLPTGQLLQTIPFRGRGDPIVEVSYVELGQRHAFICTRSDVLIFPLDPSDSHDRAPLRFPTGVEGLDEVFKRHTYTLKYSDNGEPIYESTASRRTNLVPCVLSRDALSDPVIWHCSAVHVSPCGSHFVVTDGMGYICIFRDFERALRDGIPLRDSVTIVNMGFPIMYLAYENDCRIAVYVDDRGVFVLPHIINVTVPINTCTADPVNDMIVLHARQDLQPSAMQVCSCIQLSRSELWYSWTRMHGRPGLGIANNVLRRIDFSRPPEPRAQPHIFNQNLPSNSHQSGSGWQRLAHGIHAVVWRARIPQRDLAAYTANDRLDPSELPLDPLNDLQNWAAIKVVYDICLPPHDIKREVAVLRRISHKNIIKVLDFVQGGIEAPYSMYMPLIPLSLVVLLSSPLFTPETLSGPYSPFLRPVLSSQDGPNPFEVVSKSIIYQLLLAVAYLHSLDPPVSHRDINPSNVLIDESGNVKLIDFGVVWDQPNPLHMERPNTKPLLANVLTKNWEETPDDMCSHVSTGPHRAPELLFSPPIYLATAIDRWSLGTTIAQFFTPLQLAPSSSPVISSNSFPLDENESSPAFIIPPSLISNIDYRARWNRCTLFDGERGELGLAWSIFRLRGTPSDETWPSFSLLPDVNKIEFRQTQGRRLDTVLPNLPSSSSSKTSLLGLIHGFLAYEPSTRLSPAEALKHPYFSEDLLLPSDRLDETQPYLGITSWNGKTLAGWLEPALKREASRVTRIE